MLKRSFFFPSFSRDRKKTVGDISNNIDKEMYINEQKKHSPINFTLVEDI